MKVPVKNLANEAVGEIELDDAIFGVAVREDLIHRAVNWQLAKRRSGNHKTKGISEISGTTKKPYNQKGTGRARQGFAAQPAVPRRRPDFRAGRSQPRTRPDQEGSASSR